MAVSVYMTAYQIALLCCFALLDGIQGTANAAKCKKCYLKRMACLEQLAVKLK